MIDINPTQVYWDILEALNSQKFNIFGLQGGTRSSKTYSILQALTTICAYAQSKLLISVVSESFPHLKRGAMRDFLTIMDIHTGTAGWHASDKIYTFPNECRIEFFSADSAERLRGAGRDFLFLNECNNITHEAARQLMVRTRLEIFMDWNPQTAFWFHEKYQHLPTTWFHISTHWDNHHLEEAIRARIEAAKTVDPEWYRVYGQGQLGTWHGKVFPKLRQTNLQNIFDKIDHDKLRRGLDFGYYPDPCVFLVTARDGDVIYIFKEIVATEILNEDLAQTIRPWTGDATVWCDSASPDRIAALRKHGINARSVGSKDRNYSIAWLRHCEIVIDSDCRQTFKELDNYSRKTDRNGEALPIFQDGNDHCVDSLRYSFKPDMSNDAQIKSIHLQI